MDNGSLIIRERPELAIVSPEWFFAVQARREQGRNFNPGGPRNVYTLSQKVQCPSCKNTLIAYKRRNATHHVYICPQSKKHRTCDFQRAVDMHLLEKVVIGEGLNKLMVGERSFYREAARAEFERLAGEAPGTRQELERKIALIEKQITVIAEKTAADSSIAVEIFNKMIADKDAELKTLRAQLSRTPRNVVFPEDDDHLLNLTSALSMVTEDGPFLPVSEEEFDVFTLIRKSVLSVALSEKRDGRMDVTVTFDKGPLHGLEMELPETLVFPDRLVSYFHGLKEAGRQATKEAMQPNRLLLTDEEWASRPRLPVTEKACSKLSCGGRRLFDAFVVSAEIGRSVRECRAVNGSDSASYSRASDKIRLSEELDDLIKWLSEIRPHVSDWSKLHLKRSRLPTLLMCFQHVKHPMLSLDRISGRAEFSAISSQEWEALVPELKKVRGYSMSRNLQNMNALISLLATGSETKKTLGNPSATQKFTVWLRAFDRLSNLEKVTRVLLENEGKDASFETCPKLPKTNALKRTDALRKPSKPDNEQAHRSKDSASCRLRRQTNNTVRPATFLAKFDPLP